MQSMRNPIVLLTLLAPLLLGADLAPDPDAELGCGPAESIEDEQACALEYLGSLDDACESMIEEIGSLLASELRDARWADHSSWKSHRDAFCNTGGSQSPDPLFARRCEVELTESYFMQLEEELVSVESESAAAVR